MNVSANWYNRNANNYVELATGLFISYPCCSGQQSAVVTPVLTNDCSYCYMSTVV